MSVGNPATKRHLPFGSAAFVDVSGAVNNRREKCYCIFGRWHCQFYVVDVVENLRQMLRPLIDHWSGCFDGNVIGIIDQLDVCRRCWNVGQIVIEERWRQNSIFYHYCFHLYAFRFLLPKMIFGSSVRHIIMEPVTDCFQYVGVVDTI